MKNLAVARRYAKALLLLGKDDGNVEQYREELAAVAGLMAENPALETTVSNPLYELGDRRNVLESVLAKLGLSKMVHTFLILLFEKGRIGFLKDVNEFYQVFSDEYKGVARASIVAAAELSDDAAEKIREALAKRTGKQIELDVSQDPALIGGIITRIGDLVLDGSIKTQLETMRESLKRGEIV